MVTFEKSKHSIGECPYHRVYSSHYEKKSAALLAYEVIWLSMAKQADAGRY